MKNFEVYVDITVSKVMYIEANSEEEATRIAEEKLKSEPFYWAKNCDSVVGHKIFDVVEEV